MAYSQIVIFLFGIIMFLFLFWKRLKEDYAVENIFTSAFYSLFGIGIGMAVSKYFLGPFWFWLSFLGAILGLSLGIFRFKLRFYEIIEAFCYSGLPLLSLTFLENAIKKSDVASVAGFLLTLLLVAFFLLLDANYKNFTWYKSGRVGFVGLSVLGTFFVVRGVISILIKDYFSYSGNWEGALSGVAALACFLLLFNLSRNL